MNDVCQRLLEYSHMYAQRSSYEGGGGGGYIVEKDTHSIESNCKQENRGRGRINTLSTR